MKKQRTGPDGKVRDEYWVWRDIKQRCQNRNNQAYYNYGARGIKVSPEWQSFEGFFADMGSRPSPKHTIERKDNNGPYCATNCVWADRLTQNDNSRNAHRLTYQGQTHCVAWWCRKLGLSYRVIQQRVGKLRWSVERAFNTEIRKRGAPCA